MDTTIASYLFLRLRGDNESGYNNEEVQIIIIWQVLEIGWKNACEVCFFYNDGDGDGGRTLVKFISLFLRKRNTFHISQNVP